METEPNEMPVKPRHASELADRCAGLARNLTYNDDAQQSTIKHTLRECSYFIDSQVCRVHKKRDGLLLITARGHSRLLTWRERAARWLLQGKLEIRL